MVIFVAIIMNIRGIIACILISLSYFTPTFSQNSTNSKGDIRGFVYNASNGDRLNGAGVSVFKVQSTANNGQKVLQFVRMVYADAEAFYALTGLEESVYVVQVSFPGFDTMLNELTVKNGSNARFDAYLSRIEKMDVIEIEAKGKPKETKVGSTTIEGKTIYKMPAIGAEPDILQYLQVLPGVVFSGDQGGQLYIRGGSPVMNKVMMDGLTIYNPFHSIGLFSVFETDLIQSADVYSAGFGAEYGGRISAVVDIKTRDGNRKEHKTKLGLTTFTSKILQEGPIRKYKKGKNNSSYAFSYRNSFLKQSAGLVYPYIDAGKLPYNFGDFFLKLNFNSANGGYSRLYGFHFSDNVRFPGSTQYRWAANGVGGKFLVVPEQAKTRVDGYFLYSDYRIQQIESDAKPRESSIGGFNMGMNFNYNFKRDDFRWGLELNGFQTNFQLTNANNRLIKQLESTTEINSFANYRMVTKKVIANFGLRAQYYASLANSSLEPRFQFRYNPYKTLGIKFAAGLYSQNFLSAMSDRDVVNLFYGFLSGPDNIPETFNGEPVTHRLQKARHAVGGFDFKMGRKHTFNAESFIKVFDQITNINRDKLFDDNQQNLDKPARLRQDFIIENGNAYGGDVSYKYSHKGLYVWLVYSLTYVNRFDGVQEYQPNFDRRHNANAMVSYEFDKKNPTEISLRWNFGSGFPFTQTQGYYEKQTFSNGISTDYVGSNGDLGVFYARLNGGRLPYYHRLDFSAKRNWKLENGKEFNMIFSITNVYNRANIFYYDRVRRTRVDQLPILPALGCNYTF